MGKIYELYRKLMAKKFEKKVIEWEKEIQNFFQFNSCFNARNRFLADCEKYGNEKIKKTSTILATVVVIATVLSPIFLNLPDIFIRIVFCSSFVFIVISIMLSWIVYVWEMTYFRMKQIDLKEDFQKERTGSWY